MKEMIKMAAFIYSLFILIYFSIPPLEYALNLWKEYWK